MSDLSAIPKAHVANKSQLADFVELGCLRRDDYNVSGLDVVRLLIRESEDSATARVRQEDGVEQLVNEVFDELADRVTHSGPNDGRYPFELGDEGRLLQLRDDIERAQLRSYLYLLLSTRMNMQTERQQNGEDATKLFEELCCEVGVRY